MCIEYTYPTYNTQSTAETAQMCARANRSFFFYFFANLITYNTKSPFVMLGSWFGYALLTIQYFVKINKAIRKLHTRLE